MKKNSVILYLLLGSNMGDRAAQLRRAAEKLEDRFTLIRHSAIYETDSWGDRSQNAYLNQVLEVSSHHGPQEVHAITRAIEKNMGRTEKGNYQPRTIDIDILFHGQNIVRTKHLIIPHPRIQIRRFVLVPLCEIAAEFEHPVLGKSMQELLDQCEDALEVKKYVAD